MKWVSKFFFLLKNNNNNNDGGCRVRTIREYEFYIRSVICYGNGILFAHIPCTYAQKYLVHPTGVNKRTMLANSLQHIYVRTVGNAWGAQSTMRGVPWYTIAKGRVIEPAKSAKRIFDIPGIITCHCWKGRENSWTDWLSLVVSDSPSHSRTSMFYFIFRFPGIPFGRFYLASA